MHTTNTARTRLNSIASQPANETATLEQQQPEGASETGIYKRQYI